MRLNSSLKGIMKKEIIVFNIRKRISILLPVGSATASTPSLLVSPWAPRVPNGSPLAGGDKVAKIPRSTGRVLIVLVVVEVAVLERWYMRKVVVGTGSRGWFERYTTSDDHWVTRWRHMMMQARDDRSSEEAHMFSDVWRRAGCGSAKDTDNMYVCTVCGWRVVSARFNGSGFPALGHSCIMESWHFEPVSEVHLTIRVDHKSSIRCCGKQHKTNLAIESIKTVLEW